MSYAYGEFETRVRATSMANILEHELTDRGFEIHVLAGALFHEETARLKKGADRVLDLVGSACRYLPNNLRIQAYSDVFFLPTDQYSSREELALARAAVLCRYLQAHCHIAVERIRVATEVETAETLLSGAKRSQVTIAVLRATGKKGLL